MRRFFISFFAFSISHCCLLNFWEGDKLFAVLSASSPNFFLAEKETWLVVFVVITICRGWCVRRVDNLRTKSHNFPSSEGDGEKAIFLSANFVSVSYLFGIHSSAVKPISVEFPIFSARSSLISFLALPHPDVFWWKLFYCRRRSGSQMINEKPNVTGWHEFSLPSSLHGERNFPINSLPISISWPQPLGLWEA